MPVFADELDDLPRVEEMRCVALIDESLPAGKAANAAAVMALTMGARHPHLVGAALLDSAGNLHPGLVPIGIAVLGAPADELVGVRDKAKAPGSMSSIFRCRVSKRPAMPSSSGWCAKPRRRMSAISASCSTASAKR
jgi:uncharacterized protein DUF2000